MSEKEKKKKATILFADIAGCSVASDNYDIEHYNKFLNQFHKSAIDAKREIFPKSAGWTTDKIEFSVRGDETCLILHSGNKENDIKGAILFAIFLKLRWLVSKENQERVKIDKLPRELGIGINQGVVWYDNHSIDEGEKKETSEGYAINLAKRIEGASRNGRYSKVFVSEGVKVIAEKLLLGSGFDKGKRYEDLKGISNPPYLYEMMDIDPTFITELIPGLLLRYSTIDIDKYIEIAEANPHEFWLNKLVKFSLGLDKAKKSGKAPILVTKKRTPEDWFEEGVKAAYLKKYEKAIKFFQEAIKKPDYYEAWIRMGNVYFSMENYDEAIRCYEEAKKIDPQKWDSWHNSGLAYQMKIENKEALADYQKAVKIMPGDYDSWYNMAIVYSLLKQEEKGLEALKEAISSNPGLRKKAKENHDFKDWKDLSGFKQIVNPAW